MTSDARTTLARPDLAARGLEGLIRAETFADVTTFRVKTSHAAVRAAAAMESEQVNQLLFGEIFDSLDTNGRFVWGQARRDGYVGWVDAAALSETLAAPTHWVKALRTVAFATPLIKSTVWGWLSLNALATVARTAGAMALVADAGWVPIAHLAPIGREAAPPADTAERFLGAPYVWGGRDSLGLDCSGLIQQALYAAGLSCPRDTDQQTNLGRDINPDDLRRGDLVFWNGHVGMMLDAESLLHANAYHMAVAVEPLSEAIRRIAENGVGRPTAFRRICSYRAKT